MHNKWFCGHNAIFVLVGAFFMKILINYEILKNIFLIISKSNAQNVFKIFIVHRVMCPEDCVKISCKKLQ